MKLLSCNEPWIIEMAEYAKISLKKRSSRQSNERIDVKKRNEMSYSDYPGITDSSICLSCSK